MAEEQNLTEELINEPTSNLSLEDPPEYSEMSQDDDDYDDDDDEDEDESDEMQQDGPVHERCVHGEINSISVPLDRRDVYFSLAEPYELQPLSKYFHREWSEAEHLFKPVIDFLEEMYSDWSPCPSPSPTSIGL